MAAPSLHNSRRSLLFLTTAWSLEPDNSVGYTCYRARLPHRRQCRQLPSPTYYNRSTYSRGLLQSTPAIPLEHCRVLGHLRARSCCCDRAAVIFRLSPLHCYRARRCHENCYRAFLSSDWPRCVVTETDVKSKHWQQKQQHDELENDLHKERF